MTKENNHGPYEFLGNMVVSLMNVDPSVSIFPEGMCVPCGKGKTYTSINMCA